MKTISLILLYTLGLIVLSSPAKSQTYLERFTMYTQWNQHLPEHPDKNFLEFVNGTAPLSKKLREKWLYQLVREKDWLIFSKYYQPTTDVNLQCYAELANYNLGKVQSALAAAKSLWLTGTDQPAGCNALFRLMINYPHFDESLITKRIALALEKRNLSLARYLLKQYKIPRLKDEHWLLTIYQSPSRITELPLNDLQPYFYLYGLKRLVSINMDKAMRLSQTPTAKKYLSVAQQQAFLAHVALYKAMRNHDDAPIWFTKVKPLYYNDVLLNWQIRFALKRHQWTKVEQLIHYLADKQNPCWQYWLARSYEALGKKNKALSIYQSLSETRNYYGFLASLKLNKKFLFQNEPTVRNPELLKLYQPFLDNIKMLYNNKQFLEASRLLNDFGLELPKEDKIVLVSWVEKELQWYAKSVALSNTKDLTNQLSLRFPLAYRHIISEYAKNYHLPIAFIYAIIRQESAFHENIVSFAGARGLMQVMPETAMLTAKRNKIPYQDKKQLFISEKNINIGAVYLKHLAELFHQHLLLAAAAYNAGPHQVTRWLKNTPLIPVDIWIDTLPWQETRNYLKNVVSFYAVYQYRLGEKINLQPFMSEQSSQ